MLFKRLLRPLCLWRRLLQSNGGGIVTELQKMSQIRPLVFPPSAEGRLITPDSIAQSSRPHYPMQQGLNIDLRIQTIHLNQ
jgi:hypothetical protein